MTITSHVIGKTALMPFGKYSGISVKLILSEDAQYLLWIHEHTKTKLNAELLSLAKKKAAEQKEKRQWYNNMSEEYERELDAIWSDMGDFY